MGVCPTDGIGRSGSVPGGGGTSGSSAINFGNGSTRDSASEGHSSEPESLETYKHVEIHEKLY